MDLLELAAKRPACRTEQSGQSRSRSPRLLAGALYAERRRRLGITLAEPPFCIASGIPPVCRRRVQNWLIGEPSYAGSSGVDWSRAGGGGGGARAKGGAEQQEGGGGPARRAGFVQLGRALAEAGLARGQRRVQTSRMVDAASRAAMVPLRTRRARGVRRNRWSAAPHASQGKQKIGRALCRE